jgi:SAM-dependent methyltransferase
MNSAQVFTDNWNVYQKIVQNNYMHHKGFAAQTATAWGELSPAAVLDIGCGDASTMFPFLIEHPETAFTGYDLSGHALRLAASNLETLSNSIQLREGDMRSLLEQEPEQFNLVHSSFAIHHLADEAKRQLFRAVYEHLLPGGLFLYTDVFRRADRSREEYIDDYFRFVDTGWPALEAWEKQIVYDHVQEYDFPAVLSDCTGWLEVIGFKLVNLYQPDERHMMLQLRKS